MATNESPKGHDGRLSRGSRDRAKGSRPERILVVTQSSIVRSWAQEKLEEAHFTNVATADPSVKGSVKEALMRAELVVLDGSIGPYLERRKYMHDILERQPRPKVLVMWHRKTELPIQAGPDGTTFQNQVYVGGEPEVLVRAVETALHDGPLVSGWQPPTWELEVTSEEVALIASLAQGQTYTDIGHERSEKPTTVGRRAQRLRMRLGFATVAALVAWAVAAGIVAGSVPAKATR